MKSSVVTEETRAGEQAAPARSWQQRIRTIAYWAVTMIVAYEMAAGGLWDLLQIEYVRVVFAHLGYPTYLLYIIGAWKIPCAAALLAPGFPRLKEWAYAGAFFNYVGAAASHFAVGDGRSHWIGPLVFAAFTVASRALLPPARVRTPARTEIVAWLVPAGLLLGLLAFAFATLPKGPSPY